VWFHLTEGEDWLGGAYCRSLNIGGGVTSGVRLAAHIELENAGEP
jgi:hypothetical protein